MRRIKPKLKPIDMIVMIFVYNLLFALCLGVYSRFSQRISVGSGALLTLILMPLKWSEVVISRDCTAPKILAIKDPWNLSSTKCASK